MTGARIMALLGDAIKASSPAGQWLLVHGVQNADFNSDGARRGIPAGRMARRRRAA